MPNRFARVAATRFAAVRHLPTDPPYMQKAVMEVIFLEGAYRSEKVEIIISNARNEDHAFEMIKDGLIAHLNARFPTEHYRERDVLLYGF